MDTSASHCGPMSMFLVDDLLLYILSLVVQMGTIDDGCANSIMTTLSLVSPKWRSVIKSDCFRYCMSFVIRLDDKYKITTLSDMLQKGIKFAKVTGTIDMNHTLSYDVHVSLDKLILTKHPNNINMQWRLQKFSLGMPLANFGERNIIYRILRQSAPSLVHLEFGKHSSRSCMTHFLTAVCESKKLRYLAICCEDSPNAMDFGQTFITDEPATNDGLHLVLGYCCDDVSQFMRPLGELLKCNPLVALHSLSLDWEKQPLNCILENRLDVPGYDAFDASAVEFNLMQFVHITRWNVDEDGNIMKSLTRICPFLKEIFVDQSYQSDPLFPQFGLVWFVRCFSGATAPEEYNPYLPTMKIFVGRDSSINGDKWADTWETCMDCTVYNCSPPIDVWSTIRNRNVKVYSVVSRNNRYFYFFDYSTL